MGMKQLFKKIWLFSLVIFSLNALQAQEAIPQFLKHTVKAGETLGTISAKYQINKRDILLLNDFPSDKKVEAGDVVLIRTLTENEALALDKKIYTQPAKKVPVNVPEPEERVKATEPKKSATTTLRNEKTTQAKQEKQSAKETMVVSAQKTVAVGTPPASTKAVEVGPGGTKYKVADSGFHIVERGQTFYRIALIYGLSVDELKALNNMSNTNIEIGQKLKVKK